MFYFKGCPKCRGDLQERSDIYGRYISCMQCSHDLTEEEEALLKKHPVAAGDLEPRFQETDRAAA